jgi:hypothetical protein
VKQRLPLHPASSLVQKERLLLEYQTTTKLYSKAIAELPRKMGIVPRSEYGKLNDAAEKARHISADARDRLERRTASHHC